MRTIYYPVLSRLVIAGLVATASTLAGQTPSLTGPSVPSIAHTPAGAIADIRAPRIALADEPARCGTAPGPTVSVRNVVRTVGLRVYPNPFGRRTSVELPDTDRTSELHLINQLGQLVWSERYAAQAGNPVRVEIPQLPPGVYLLRWRVNDEVRGTQRVVVSR